MSFEQLIEPHHKIAYTDAVEHAMQNHGGILRPFITTMPGSGELQAITNKFDDTEAVEVTERRREVIDNPIKRERRWVAQPNPWGNGTIIDQKEIWDTMMDPTSELNVAYAKSMARREDQLILDGMLGNVTLSGNHTRVAVPLPTGNRVTVEVGGADSGLNPKKIREVRKKIAQAYTNAVMPEIYMGVTAQAVDDLLSYSEVTSSDFNTPPGGQPLMRGWVGYWGGINFVGIETLQLKAGTTDVRELPVWTKDGVKLVLWEDHVSDLRNLPHLRRNPPAIEHSFAGVAGRPFDEKIYIVEAKEPAA